MSRETILKAKAETEEMTTRGREKGTAHPCIVKYMAKMPGTQRSSVKQS